MEEPVHKEPIMERQREFSEKEAMTMINAMVRNVSKRYGMKVQIVPEGNGTFFNWRDVYVGLDARDFRRAPEAWLGAMAHEGRHVDKSRFQVIPRVDRDNPTFNVLIQILEDRFINAGIDKDYPGAGQWLRKYYSEITEKGERLNIEAETKRATGGIGFLPSFAEYTIALSREWAFGEYGFELSKNALEALKATHEFVLDYQKDDLPSSAKESDKENAQLARYFICKNHIWPIYKELYEKDMEQIQDLFFLKYLASPEGEEDAEIIEIDLDDDEKKQFKEKIDTMKEIIRKENMEKISSSEPLNKLVENLWEMSDSLRSKLKNARNQVSARKEDEFKQMSEELEKVLEDMIINYFRSKLQNPDFQMTNDEIKGMLESGVSPGTRGNENPLPSNFDDTSEDHSEDAGESRGIKIYRDLYSDVSGIIDDLSAKFDEVLIPNKFPKWVSGYPTGGRGNVQNIMQFKASRQGYNRLFERKTNPEKFDVGIALTLDLSTSMNFDAGDGVEEIKLTSAKKGVVAMGEVLDRKSIPFEIIGYPVYVGRGGYGDAKLGTIVLKGLNEPYSNKVKERIALVKAVVGSTPADMAIDEASKRMENFSASELIIINLTDGEPNSQKSLVTSINEAAKKGRSVVGLGIGNGVDADKMSKTYRISKVAKKINQLPATMAEILKEVILHKR